MVERSDFEVWLLEHEEVHLVGNLMAGRMLRKKVNLIVDMMDTVKVPPKINGLVAGWAVGSTLLWATLCGVKWVIPMEREAKTREHYEYMDFPRFRHPQSARQPKKYHLWRNRKPSLSHFYPTLCSHESSVEYAQSERL